MARTMVAEGLRPAIVLSSPQRRAVQTAQAIAAAWQLAPEIDERLREKELGALDRLTRAGVAARYPAEVTARARSGKFYYRPPGGESWCDVVQRVRNAWTDLRLQYAGEAVVVVSHQVGIASFRYVLEHLTETEVLGLAEIENASLTTYAHDPTGRGTMTLRSFNRVAR